jgi:hypothetical protein
VIDGHVTPINADPSMNRTFRGITIDSSDEDEKASDSIHVNCVFDSNVIDESDLHHEKQMDPRFQHSWESRSIEVMISKMLQIQLMSSVNLIQM